MNFLLRTLAWQTLLEKNGVINGILNWLHLPSQSMINTPSAIVLGMVYNFLPFMVLPIYNVLSKIDDNIINAAMDLGSQQLSAFHQNMVSLKHSRHHQRHHHGVCPFLTTFVISDLLGGSKILLIGNVIEQEFTRGSNWHLGSGLSLVLMVFILISMAMIAKYDKNGEGLHSDDKEFKSTAENHIGFLYGAHTDLPLCPHPYHDGPVLQQIQIQDPVGRIYTAVVHPDV